MTTFRTLVAASILISLPFGVAFAQSDPTGSGASPLATEKAPNTTAVGQTKPPSHDASPTSIKPPERLTPRQAVDDAIVDTVCVGCGRDPDTTGAVPAASMPAKPVSAGNVRLGELQTAPEPKQQSDLDTLALASAHRERAESMREKTNGLWQSWVVSICDGCGDQKPYGIRRLENVPARGARSATRSTDPKATATAVHQAEAKQAGTSHLRDLEADLSSENIESIRRMPQQ